MCTVWVYGWVMSGGLILRFGKVGKLYRAADWPQWIIHETRDVGLACSGTNSTLRLHHQKMLAIRVVKQCGDNNDVTFAILRVY